jgi:3-(3-hydroxy-phenyl)propionate hydroxylase
MSGSLNDEIFDIVIVGCGPVGAVGANLFGRAGLRTLVLEKAQDVYTLPRAIHLDHEVMRALQRAGVADLVAPTLTVPAGTMHTGADGGVIRQLRTPLRNNRFGWASDYFFYQPEFEAKLREGFARWPTLTVHYGCEVINVDQNEDVRVRVRNGDRQEYDIRARYLIACDGASSVVRKSLGIALDDLGFDERWVVVDALVDGAISFPSFSGVPEGADLQNTLILVADPRRPVSVIPGAGRHRRWECMVLPGEDDNAMLEPAALDDLLGAWTKEARCEIIRAVVYRFHALVAQRWSDGRIFLAGDSAHQTPPFYGQGLCHGIRDLANLSWKLESVIGGFADASLLETYQSEREPQVRAVIGASIKMGRYICTLDPEAAKQRDTELRNVVRVAKPGYVDIIPALEAGVALGGAVEGRGSRFVQPPVRTAGDKRDRLLDDVTGAAPIWLSRGPIDPWAAFKPGQHARFACLGGCAFSVTGDGDLATTDAQLIDTTGELEAWLTQHNADGVLIRPDGYVFAVARVGEEADLLGEFIDYLSGSANAGDRSRSALLERS